MAKRKKSMSSEAYRKRFDSSLEKIGIFFGIPVLAMEIAKLAGTPDPTARIVFGIVLGLIFLLRWEVVSK